MIDLERLFVGIIFIVYGILNSLNPEAMFGVRASFSKKIFGITYKASKETFRTFRLFGIFLICIGLLLLSTLTL
jgi:uncharacterized protein YjeT (DUF2065 family)